MPSYRDSLKPTDPLLIATRDQDIGTLRTELTARYADGPPPDVLVALACREGLVDSLSVLLDLGARTGVLGALFGGTPLHAAAANGRTAIVDRLLGHGVPVDLVDAAGQMPLHDAINHNQASMVEHLLERGANWNGVQFRMANTSRSALKHAMVEKKLPEVALALIRYGAADQKGALDGQGNTPLHVAVREQWPEVVRALLDRGLPVDPLNQRQETPLKLAVHRGGEARLTNVAVLMAYGADPLLKSDSGESALSLAQRMGGPALIAMEQAIMRRTMQATESLNSVSNAIARDRHRL